MAKKLNQESKLLTVEPEQLNVAVPATSKKLTVKAPEMHWSIADHNKNITASIAEIDKAEQRIPVAYWLLGGSLVILDAKRNYGMGKQEFYKKHGLSEARASRARLIACFTTLDEVATLTLSQAIELAQKNRGQSTGRANTSTTISGGRINARIGSIKAQLAKLKDEIAKAIEEDEEDNEVLTPRAEALATILTELDGVKLTEEELAAIESEAA